MAKKKQGYLSREAEKVGETDRPTTENERIMNLWGVKTQTPKDRARESRGMRKAMDGTGKGEYGFRK